MTTQVASLLSVQEVLQIKDIHVAPLTNGTLAYVASGSVISSITGRAYYSLDKFNGQPEDLVFFTVIAPGPGSPIAGFPDARWIFCLPLNP